MSFSNQTYRADAKLFALGSLLLMLLFQVGSAHGAELSANVDRTVISENETVQLTVRLDEQVGYNSPDFDRLEADFEILSQQRSSQFRSINGVTETWTEWTLVLAPRTTGTLSVPSLTFQGATSNPVNITVTEASANTGADAPREIFVEVETDKSEVFVQEELLLTIRVHTGILLRDISMDEPLTVENAVVENVSETAYNKQLDGRLYRVAELVYAVYPQKSEPISIPGLTWNIVMATNRGSGLRYRFQAPGEMRRVRSESLTIPVKPKPTTYSGDHWLPASDINLEQHWSSDPSRFVVGEPLTRTITLKAEGLTSAQLPPLPDQRVGGLKVYQDQPQFDDIKTNSGITGHRIESVAIVPTRPGKLTLPEVQVTWWDTDDGEQKVATIEPQVLTIAPAAPNGRGLPFTQAQPSAEQRDTTTTSDPEPVWVLSWPWLISNAVFAALALFFMIAWLRARNGQTNDAENSHTEESANLNEAFHAVRRACSENDAVAVRNALGEWARLYWQLPHAASLEDIEERCRSSALVKELAELDKMLYGSSQPSQGQNNDWRGENLWRALVKFKRKDKKQRQEKQQTGKDRLPPLYPTT